MKADKDRLIDEGVNLETFADLCDNIGKYVDAIVSAIPDEVMEVIGPGGYTFQQIWDLDEQCLVKTTDHNPIIYTIGLSKVDGGDIDAIYHGRAGDAAVRFQQHGVALDTDDPEAHPGQFYDYGRRANGGWRMFTFADLSEVEDLGFRNKLAQVAEFASIVLDMSWNPKLFDLDASGRWSVDIMAAQTFAAMATSVFEETGWIPMRNIRGTNWQTPMLDNGFKHSTWFLNNVPFDNGHSVSVYRRSGLMVIKRSDRGAKSTRGLRIINGGAISSVSKQRAEVTLQGFYLPPLKTIVYTTVEIYEGRGQRHPKPLLNVPEPGPFSDWDDLNRIGIYTLFVTDQYKNKTLTMMQVCGSNGATKQGGGLLAMLE